MRITIDYNPDNNNFSVLVDRGTLSNGTNPFPPPPPRQQEFEEITSWLNDAFAKSMEAFKDQKTAALRFKYEPAQKIATCYKFTYADEAAPAPPPFIK